MILFVSSRQVTLIQKFAEEAFDGRSLVAQMIMGTLATDRCPVASEHTEVPSCMGCLHICID